MLPGPSPAGSASRTVEPAVRDETSGTTGVWDSNTGVWESAVRRLRSEAGASVAFGGAVEGERLRLAWFNGASAGALRGLELQRGRGLGGRVWAEQRAMAVDDYYGTQRISHDYDRQVRAEGLTTIAAAPVRVGRSARGVLYVGFRATVVGDRTLDVVIRASRALAHEISVEEEVHRRVELRTAELRRRHEEMAARARRLHAGLVAIRSSTTDECARDAAISLLEQVVVADGGTAPLLTARELDVLALVATGLTYAAVAEHLGLTALTVKSYMRDVLSRLGVRSRHLAVIEARRLGLVL